MNNPPTEFDSTEYIFIGKIIGHINTTESYSHNSKTYDIEYWGLKIELVDEVYLPDRSFKVFEVFTFDLGPDCSLKPKRKNTMESFYPIGEEIRVVAKEPEHLSDIKNKNVKRLEISPYNNFHLSLNIPYLTTYLSDSESLCKYTIPFGKDKSNLAEEIIDSLEVEDHNQKVRIRYCVYYWQDFELRKDLFRLHFFDNDADKVEVIERLKNFKDFGVVRLIKVISKYIHSEGLRNRLFTRLFIIRENVDLSKLKRKS